MGLRKMFSTLFTIAACACCASGPPVNALYSYNAQPLNPEGWYIKVYDEAKLCVETFGELREGDTSFDNIQWLVMEHNALPGIAGLWSHPNRIYIDASYTMSLDVIRHEIVHYLMGGGNFTHSDPTFQMCVGMPPAPPTAEHPND